LLIVDEADRLLMQSYQVGMECSLCSTLSTLRIDCHFNCLILLLLLRIGYLQLLRQLIAATVTQLLRDARLVQDHFRYNQARGARYLPPQRHLCQWPVGHRLCRHPYDVASKNAILSKGPLMSLSSLWHSDQCSRGWTWCDPVYGEVPTDYAVFSCQPL
jgi:hypothetical protein